MADMAWLGQLLSSAGVDLGVLNQQWDQELCLSLRVALVVATAVTVLVAVLWTSKRKQEIHVLDFAVHKPNERYGPMLPAAQLPFWLALSTMGV
jgi:hypothetical protein